MDSRKRKPSESIKKDTYEVTEDAAKSTRPTGAHSKSSAHILYLYYIYYLSICMELLTENKWVSDSCACFCDAQESVDVSSFYMTVLLLPYSILFALVWLLPLRNLSLSNDKQKGSGPRMDGKYVQNGRSRGRENYNQYIVYEKIFIFNFKKGRK